jgi:hypothetical protein
MSNTYYQIILDASGSMQDCIKNTLSSLNEQIRMVQQLAAEHPDENFFLALTDFSTDVREIRPMKTIQNLEDFQSEEYTIRSMTALLDAIGTTVTSLENQFGKEVSEENASIVVVTITDGLENASREFNNKSLKKLLRRLEKQGGWDFRFIGADIDVNGLPESFGLDHAAAYKVSKTKMGAISEYMKEDMDAIMRKKKKG